MGISSTSIPNKQCGSSTYQTSGYADRIAEFQDYPVPTFFSETGCITIRPRTFQDMTAIYGSQMTSILSGAFVYEWIQEANNYGIINYPDITLQDNLNVSVGSPIPLQPDFNNLKNQWASATPNGININDYTPSNTEITCPQTTAGIWTIDANQVLPDTPSKETPTPSGISFSFV
jgi:hypothetical protein